MSTVPDNEDPITAPLPVPSQFFTWSPGEEPAPYDPPATQTRSPRPAAVSPVPARPVVGQPGATLRKGRRQRPFIAVAAAAAVSALAAAVIFQPTADDQPSMQTVPTTTDSAPPDPDLAALLPPGYPPGRCTQLPESTNAAQCGPHPEAPYTASRFTVYPNADALAEAFDQFVRDTTVLVCPGGYQSPGPWRRNAAPSIAVGILVCGTGPRGHARVAWTLDSEHLLAAIESEPNGPALPQLYEWWSTHS